MRFKPVPDPPADLEDVAPILATVPETAGTVDDCCSHLVAETRLEDRSAAETWLVFLRALELAAEEPAGYRRTTATSLSADALDSATLGETFRERVSGADAVLEILERTDEPLSAGDVADTLRGERPALDRERRPDRRENAGRDRVRRLLEWAVLLELAERTADGDRYRPPTESE